MTLLTIALLSCFSTGDGPSTGPAVLPSALLEIDPGYSTRVLPVDDSTGFPIPPEGSPLEVADDDIEVGDDFEGTCLDLPSRPRSLSGPLPARAIIPSLVPVAPSLDSRSPRLRC